MRRLFQTKPIVSSREPSELRRHLSAFDLTLLGVGAIIGAGVFVLTGIVASTQAGPAIIISFLIAALACGFTALSYAELAASVGGCGSAYGYSYAAFGELIAWIIGWDLILEYAIAVSAVAVGWSGYFNNILMGMGFHLPTYLLKPIFEGGFINLPAVLIISLITITLALGIQVSTRINNIVVYIKLGSIALFIAIAAFNVKPEYWHPFVPFGWQGVMHGAAFIFFAYIGFDAVSTAAEEAKNPQRDLPIGIICSLVVCTITYIIVAGLLTGIAPYTTLNVASPVAEALLRLGYNIAGAIVAVGAIAGLTTVILVMFYGLTRIFFAMARDGLLPALFTHVHKRTRTPVRVILIAGLVMALISGFVPMSDLAELVNIGTLGAFIIVCGGVLVLRYTRNDISRPFKTPFTPIIPLLGILSCSYLIANLTEVTWIRFGIWMAIGCVVYFCYGYTRSKLRVGNKL